MKFKHQLLEIQIIFCSQRQNNLAENQDGLLNVIADREEKGKWWDMEREQENENAAWNN